MILDNLELSFASGLDLSVRHFGVSEAISGLFDVSVVALSRIDDVDFDAVVGQGASFRINGGSLGAMPQARAWTGICSQFEQVQGEETGLSTYHLRIVPHLWLATQRQNNRIFQHVSIPEIVEKLLAEWQITPVSKIDKGQYPRFEYRVQYAETDYAFLSRLLEEAGISFFFEFDGEKGQSQLVLSDRPQAAEHRPGGPMIFHDQPPREARVEYLTRLTVAQRVRQGAHTIRDFDFQRRPDFELFGKAAGGRAPEDRLEHYQYEPGAFLVEGTAAGDVAAAGASRHDEKEGAALASRGLEGERKSRVTVGFESSALTLAPGTIFSVASHPHPLFGAGKNLLVTELALSGAPGAEWSVSGRAAQATEPFRPARKTPRPKITGVQSAVVVGPEGAEIHTDEYGRVRVQFHWDREGQMNEKSSCWIRVSQGWAGGGYGMMTIPRVGQEVTVGFLEGNPDQPLIIGRVFNNTTRVPYALPKNQTRSGWKTSSTPSSDGFNEIMLEDQKGAELISIQAQRDLTKLVKMDEVERTGGSRTISVGRSRKATIGGMDSTVVGQRHEVVIKAEGGGGGGAPTSLTMSDKKIVYTTGQASLTFDGPDVALEAEGNITITARSGDVIIKGGPNVKINCD
ncbi:type VI secretion system Vgr family protein [Chondromyces apiculatus]|uniref:VgrG protein n=1 Tax=Chondromyces apiculatus DSM 436 TaxID=1192034 RepID=A0A017T525_9BACT|nr:type VI secretion system tip protein TssI/VgrG [Chondromyces apiculatus]EYF04077.1 VgrG protein [Chondromyces apiculatus DSM 436]